MPLPIRKRRKRDKKIKILFFVIIVIFVVVFIDNQLRPMVKQIAENTANRVSVQAINEAITEVLEAEGIRYEDIVSINNLSDGEISSITTDIVKVNMLKSAVNSKIQEKILDSKYKEIKIPLGTLTGSEILAGRGPKINVKIKLHSNVVTDLESTFSQAGINQTLHQLKLNVSASIFIEIPGYTTSANINTNFQVAETVIVGRVPNSYTSVNGDDSSVVSKVNDYTTD